jgi:hypothetical protein
MDIGVIKVPGDFIIFFEDPDGIGGVRSAADVD